MIVPTESNANTFREILGVYSRDWRMFVSNATYLLMFFANKDVGMTTGLPGLRGADHIGFTVPNLEVAHATVKLWHPAHPAA